MDVKIGASFKRSYLAEDWGGKYKQIGGKQNEKDPSMKQSLETGVHFGHQTRRWNPKIEEIHL